MGSRLLFNNTMAVTMSKYHVTVTNCHAITGGETGRVTNISVYFKFDFIINFYASHLITPTSAIPYHTANLKLMTRKAFRKGIYLEN